MAALLEVLTAKFLIAIGRRVEVMRAALPQCADDGVARWDVQRIGHQIRGTAATVNLPDLGALGGAIERIAARTPWGADDAAQLASAVELVSEYADHARRYFTPPSIAADPRYQALLRDGP